MFADFDFSEFWTLLPEISLLLLAGLVMLLDLLWPQSRKRGLGLVTAVGLGAIIVLTLAFALPGDSPEPVFGGMISNDWLTLVFRVLVLFAAMVTSLTSLDLKDIGDNGAYYAILLIATLGLGLMAAGSDLIMIYLAVETASICLYLLAGFLRRDQKSTEAGLKYFLFGAFTSTVMLYGFSLLFGLAGGTGLSTLAEGLRSAPSGALVIVVALVLVGFGFKVAAVPFHFWTPDVYEGAPTPITAYISVASKAAGFAVLSRVMLAAFPGVQEFWAPLIAAIAAATMTLGNVLALAQRNIKRMLAYSSIAHAGYALIGLAALSELGVASLVFYLMTYVLTNLTAFGVVIIFARVAGSDEIADYAGMSRRAPGLALAMAVAMLSLGGMPPLAGFFGKFGVFAAAVGSQQGLVWLAVVGVLNAIVGLYYYLTVLKVVYLYRSEKDEIAVPVPRAYSVALVACIAGIFLLGTLAAPWFAWATKAAQNLF